VSFHPDLGEREFEIRVLGGHALHLTFRICRRMIGFWPAHFLFAMRVVPEPVKGRGGLVLPVVPFRREGRSFSVHRRVRNEIECLLLSDLSLCPSLTPAPSFSRNHRSIHFCRFRNECS
jgi:hypothetical protein